MAEVAANAGALDTRPPGVSTGCADGVTSATRLTSRAHPRHAMAKRSCTSRRRAVMRSDLETGHHRCRGPLDRPRARRVARRTRPRRGIHRASTARVLPRSRQRLWCARAGQPSQPSARRPRAPRPVVPGLPRDDVRLRSGLATVAGDVRQRAPAARFRAGTRTGTARHQRSREAGVERRDRATREARPGGVGTNARPVAASRYGSPTLASKRSAPARSCSPTSTSAGASEVASTSAALAH